MAKSVVTPETAQKQFVIIVVFGILLMTAFLVMAVFSVREYQRSQQLLAEYRQAPGCTKTSIPTSPLPPCVREPMHVVDKDRVYHSRSSDDYYLFLRGASGPDEKVRLIGHKLYDSVSIGSVVTAKFWQHKIRLVITKDYQTQTSDHPEHLGKSALSGIIVGALGMVLFAFVIGSSYRTLQRTRLPEVPWTPQTYGATRFKAWDVHETPTVLTMTARRVDHLPALLGQLTAVVLVCFLPIRLIYLAKSHGHFDTTLLIIVAVFAAMALFHLYSLKSSLLHELQVVFSGDTLEFNRDRDALTRNGKRLGALDDVTQVLMRPGLTSKTRQYYSLWVLLKDDTAFNLGTSDWAETQSIRPFGVHLAQFLGRELVEKDVPLREGTRDALNV